MATLIGHFYNEAFLLPYWLTHHRRLFTHGVLIDYASTDDSVALIREICPTWQVLPSTVPHFGAAELDEQVMAVERQLPGWKLVLNTTEFLLCPDLAAFIREREAGLCPPAIGFPSVVMADPPALRGTPVGPGSLPAQRHWGYPDPFCQIRRHRYLHRADCGHYEIGRHATRLPCTVAPELPIFWYGFSPMDEVIERKLQIQTRIPPHDRARGWGQEHLVTRESLEVRWAGHAALAWDLTATPEYRALIDACKE